MQVGKGFNTGCLEARRGYTSASSSEQPMVDAGDVTGTGDGGAGGTATNTGGASA